MLAGIERARFDRLGAFPYSVEDGTPAGAMEKQVASATRQRRWHAVMRAQQAIAAELAAARVGQPARVLIEGRDPERAAWVGRSAAEAPEIDGKIFIPEGALPSPPAVGAFVDVEIIASEIYDWEARPIAAVAR
jgi:ribosomal protein S12 methylthiotransferase